jgi:hypothetical protein
MIGYDNSRRLHVYRLLENGCIFNLFSQLTSPISLDGLDRLDLVEKG